MQRSTGLRLAFWSARSAGEFRISMTTVPPPQLTTKPCKRAVRFREVWNAMNSKKTKGLAFRLRIVVALFALGVSLGWVFLRHAYAPRSENVTWTALANWWRIEFAYGGGFLVLLAPGLFLS